VRSRKFQSVSPRRPTLSAQSASVTNSPDTNYVRLYRQCFLRNAFSAAGVYGNVLTVALVRFPGY
jgi:hypothetical protein